MNTRMFLFGLSHQWLRYMDETIDEHPVLRMQPQTAPQLVFIS